jgi:hypothetical protein
MDTVTHTITLTSATHLVLLQQKIFVLITHGIGLRDNSKSKVALIDMSWIKGQQMNVLWCWDYAGIVLCTWYAANLILITSLKVKSLLKRSAKRDIFQRGDSDCLTWLTNEWYSYNFIIVKSKLNRLSAYIRLWDIYKALVSNRHS